MCGMRRHRVQKLPRTLTNEIPRTMLDTATASAREGAGIVYAQGRTFYDSQLVFSTFAPTQFASDDLELLYGGTRAHNRAMVDFCSAIAAAERVPGL